MNEWVDLVDFRNKLYEMADNFKDFELQGKRFVKTNDVIRLIGRMIRYIDRQIDDWRVDRTREDW